MKYMNKFMCFGILFFHVLYFIFHLSFFSLFHSFIHEGMTFVIFAHDLRPKFIIPLGIEMAIGTRNPNIRRVLPDMKAGTG
jgi:hypothetical protein